jgi:hypothetical protein
MKQFRLPDGTATTGPDKYVQAWLELADGAAALFPGYQVNGVDPDITLFNDKGVMLRLTVDQAKVLVDLQAQHLRIRKLFGARDEETMSVFLDRLEKEEEMMNAFVDQLEQDLDELGTK